MGCTKKARGRDLHTDPNCCLLLFQSATSQILIGGDSGMDVSEIYDEHVVCQNNIPKTWLVLTPLQNVYSLVVGEIQFFSANNC